MKHVLILSAGLLMIAGNAFAAGSHTSGHEQDKMKKETHGHDNKKSQGHDNSDDHHADKMAVGEPGKREDAVKNIVIVMKETDDGDMIFSPKKIDVKKGKRSVLSSKTKASWNMNLFSITMMA